MKPIKTGKVRYEVFGPYPFHTSVEATYRYREALKEFWGRLEKDGSPEAGLSGAVGVYVWTVKQDGKRLPWNVGLTDRQGFKNRFVQKEATFLRLLHEQPDAEIEVYLLALRSKTGKFRKPTDSQVINANHWLETMLIGSAISVNPNLRNTAKAGYLTNAVVEGYLNDTEEKRSPAAKSFSSLFKAQPRKRN
jgi:hypothetical protein